MTNVGLVEVMGIPDYIFPLDNMTEGSQENYVGFSDIPVNPTELIRSAFFMGDPSSYIDVLYVKNVTSKYGLSICMWIKPRAPSLTNLKETILDFSVSVSNQSLVIFLYEKRVGAKLCSSPGTSCTEFFSHGLLSVHDWNFIAFAYSVETNKGTFFINSTFGIQDKEGTYFDFSTQEWFAKSTDARFLRIGSDIENQYAFLGEISCLQISNRMLSISQIYQMSQICHVIKDYPRAKPCPSGYFLMNMNCFKISSSALSFTDAELSCISEPNNPYVTRLAYPESYVTMENLMSYAKHLKNISELYVGLDSISGIDFNQQTS